MADEDGDGLVAVDGVHLQPMGHHGSVPDAAPIDLLGGDARDAAVEFGQTIGAVPFGQAVEPLLHGVEEGCCRRADVQVDDGAGIAVADSLATCQQDDAVERSVVEYLPDALVVVVGGGVKGEKLVLFVEGIVTELEVLFEERFDTKGVLFAGGCNGCTRGFLVGYEVEKIVVFLKHKF